MGSTCSAKNASSSDSPPTTPGTMAPGLHNSIVNPSVPRLSRMYAMFGCATALRMR